MNTPTHKIRQIITRPDFDGVVCAILLKEALGRALPVRWVQPNQIQDGTLALRDHDVVANLPILDTCGMWFDHHVSNKTKTPFEGLFRIAPSAAGLVYEYFQKDIAPGFKELVNQADKIDAAQLNPDEIRHPEKHPYILLSMTIQTNRSTDQSYCDHLVELLGTQPVASVMADDTVKQRCDMIVIANRDYRSHLLRHTRIQDAVSITDFRGLTPAPDGNRFLVYSLFPETVANVKLFDDGPRTTVKLGHSIINRGCRVNVGQLMARYGGGGHFGAGACRLPKEDAEANIQHIIRTMVENQPVE